MRIPNPKAVTTTEAYLAYKAEVLEQSELKDKLYHPYLHIDGWLAYWTGLTDNYPTDKNGDPECLTDEEAYIAYLAGVTSEYPEALKDPADVRVASYLRYLVSVRFGRPDYPVTREELYLSMMKPSFIPSGDPSSEIELDGTVEAPFIDLKMYGDTFQQTYSGKNLFDYNTNLPSTWNNQVVQTTDITLQPNTQYTMSSNIPLASNAYADIFFYDSTGSGGTSTNGVAVNKPVTVTTLSDGIVKVGHRSNVGTTINRDSYWYQIEQGVQATSWEKFVGGTASPNPDYPQDIQVVTGEQTVNVHGKNMLQNNATTQNISGVDFTVNPDGTITVDGTASAQIIYNINTGVNLTGKYTLSGCPSGGSDTTYKLQLYGTGGVDDMGSGNITTNPNGTVRIVIRNGVQVNNLVFKPMLESGNQPTSYEPYQSTTKTIDLGSIELAKIDTYEDGIFKNDPTKSWYNPDLEDNAWYVHKEVGKVVLDGTIGGFNSGNDWYYAGVGALDISPATTQTLSNYFTASNESYMIDHKTVDGLCAVNHSKTHFILRNLDCTSANEYRTWLGNTNPIFYYALATPTDTKITDATLVGQLEAIKEGGSYNGKTYIKVTATDPNLPGLLYVEAAI